MRKDKQLSSDDQKNHKPGENEGKSLIEEFLSLIWKGKLTLLGFTVAGLAIASLYLHFSTYRYTASLSVIEASADSPLPSGMRGIASLAGISLKSDSSKLSQYLAALRSRDVAEVLARDDQLMRRIFADQWNPAKGEWQEPPSTIRELANIAKSVLGAPVTAWSPPGAVSMQRYIDRNVGNFTDIKTNITSVSFADKDPQFAVSFLASLHRAADDHVRQRTIAKSQQYVEYITRRLPTLTLVEHRIALAQVLSEQEAQMMMASATGSYAVEPLGQIVSSPKPVNPKPMPVLAAGAAFGLVGGLLIFFLRYRRRLRVTAGF